MWRARVRQAVENCSRATGYERLKLISIYAKKASYRGMLRLLQSALFNPMCLRLWVWILNGRAEFFGTSNSIGDMVTMVEYYLKKKLHVNSRVVSVYLINKPHLANPYLARLQAKSFGTPRILVVMNRFLCLLLAPLERQLFYSGSQATFAHHLPELHDLNARYNFHLERHVPLADRQRARALMERIGLPREAKFVCVHAREEGFKAHFALQRDGHNIFRNADILTYRAAIEYLVRQGFWVVRMGEATVKPLPPMEHVIEYARSPLKSDFLDIVLIAECEFYVGSSAGLANVAYLFNKFLLLTNALPLESAAWSDRSFWIPKLVYSQPERRYLTYVEVIQRGIGEFHKTHQYLAAQLELHDNSPEEILEATRELHRWSLGDPGYSTEERRAQRAFVERFPPDYIGYGTRSNICVSFIRRHRELMPQPAPADVPTDRQHDSLYEGAGARLGG
ncbi:MAG: TIGR04372 family glycosyltransferase [Candidatus Omnitrophica bacterium]|nr:TIGR04372 family glycosyltransferase [Candidatus Omnitrophota bacterium]